jgi:hypothetical protein|tara:strand:+ start:7628 stop:7894 length:267 start_codon:yes stop_codon:yes gene_type:complete
MKYYLVDKLDTINTSVELESEVGVAGAKTYFLGVKQIEEKEFDNLWRVMTKEEWDTQFKLGLQGRQNPKLKYQWWEEDKAITDEELKN